MFKLNDQPSLITFESELSEKQRNALNKSKEKWFYQLIFCNINELDFKNMYSDKKSRPNVPVNILVSALILKEIRGISYDELMDSLMFDLRMKVALGLERIDEIPFAQSTLFNFQKKILDYQNETGINLLEEVFNKLSTKQIKQLKLKANIQRTDSTLVSANIRKYSRVQLLIEILLRILRVMDEGDKKFIVELLKDYVKEGSQKYVYGLRSKDLPHELNKLGKIYQEIHSFLYNKEVYFKLKEFKNFERVYKEHFVVVDKFIEPRSTNELHSGMLQSPDDSDATYRNKRGQESKGFLINVSETANPDNDIQLLTDVSVSKNNVDDSKILNERVDQMVEKTPELEEIHTDGGYGSTDNDEKFEQMGITQVTTAVRGRESKVNIIIEKTETGDNDNDKDKSNNNEDNTYTVECPYQKVTSTATKQRHKVRFDRVTCQSCPLKDKCNIYKNKGRFYFTHKDYLKNKRNNRINNIPYERRKIRPNVEATMKEIKSKTTAGKLKIRGLFKTELFAYSVGIAINFGRIFRYFMKMPENVRFRAMIMAQNLMFFVKFFGFFKKLKFLLRFFGFLRNIFLPQKNIAFS